MLKAFLFLLVSLCSAPLGFAQTAQGTASPSPLISPKKKPPVIAQPSPSPSASVQLPPDLLPDPQHAPVPTPPPPPANDLLPSGSPQPTPATPPANPQDLLPATPAPQASPTGSPKKLAEQMLKEKMRFRQLQSIAERDPHAIEMWTTAHRQSTMEYRREWERLYYVYICTMMRKLDPSVSDLIDAWEQNHVSAQSTHNSKPTVPLNEINGAGVGE